MSEIMPPVFSLNIIFLAFLESNWKRFNDAIQCHRLYIVHDILPRYGICVA